MLVNTVGARYSPPLGSLAFYDNDGGADDYATLLTIPSNCGLQFSIGAWLRLDPERSIGDAADGTGPGGVGASQAVWPNNNPARYGSASWWFAGAFALDGHNNTTNRVDEGTFSWQIYNSGRLRWTLGDGSASIPTGGLWAMQGGAALLDGAWHWVECVRRFSGGDAILELWIDGVLIDSQTSDSQTNLYTAYWQNWTNYPSGQEGWFLGGEKISCLGGNRWTDYWGELAELRFWSRAKSEAELESATSWEIIDGLARAYRPRQPLGGRVYAEGSGDFITMVPRANAQFVSARP